MSLAAVLEISGGDWKTWRHVDFPIVFGLVDVMWEKICGNGGFNCRDFTIHEGNSEVRVMFCLFEVFLRARDNYNPISSGALFSMDKNLVWDGWNALDNSYCTLQPWKFPI